MSNQNEAAVVLLSGGLDSTVLLHYIARRLGRRPVHVISFNYGQRHSKELECAKWHAATLGTAEHRIIDISFFGGLVKNTSALVAGGRRVPDLKELDKSQLEQPPTYVPNRNMILLSLAAAYAEAHGIADVFYGAQAQDEYGYWDCTAGFLERINNVLSLNRRTPIAVHAPFVAKPKSEGVKLGLELGVDFSHTWSCYRGAAKACGTCPTCVERLAAFKQAGVTDPLTYE